MPAIEEGEQRRGNDHPLSDEQIEAIAEKAADKAVAKITANVYQNVGKSVVSKFFYFVGVVTIALYFYLSSKGVKVL